jgi:hypothetical protein
MFSATYFKIKLLSWKFKLYCIEKHARHARNKFWRELNINPPKTDVDEYVRNILAIYKTKLAITSAVEQIAKDMKLKVSINKITDSLIKSNT